MTTPTRKKHTGEPGNGGQFGHKTQSEADISLGAAQSVPPAETQRARRGHDFYPADFTSWPKTLSGASVPLRQKEVLAHYFVGAIDYYVTESDSDGYAFGYTHNEQHGEGEWGYIDLTELERTKIGWNVVERDLWHEPRTMVRDCVPQFMVDRTVVEMLPYSEKQPYIDRWHLDNQAHLRRTLDALGGGITDQFVDSLMDGHLSRGTPGEKGVAAVLGWRIEATTMAASDNLTDQERDAYASFSEGIQRATVRLFADKLDLEDPGALEGNTLEDAARQAEALAHTKRASKTAREEWRKQLKLAGSEAEWRGQLVAAAALSHTDSWWGFRDDTRRTITAGYVTPELHG